MLTLPSFLAFASLAGCPYGSEDDSAAAADSAAPVDSATGTGLVLTVSAPRTPVDECEPACISALVTLDGTPVPLASVDLWVGTENVGADLRTSKAGLAEACPVGLPTGTHEVLAVLEEGGERFTAVSSVQVRRFGHAAGIAREDREVTELPYTPKFTRVGNDPVLPPGPDGTWDSVGTLLASVAATDTGFAMYYAGTSASDYLVGAASSTDGLSWTRHPDNPVLANDDVEGSWRQYSTNSPMLIESAGLWHTYVTGRAGETGDLTIGLATGSTPLAMEQVIAEPVFEWTAEEEDWAGQAVAHPGILQHPDGYWELWYSTGYHKIGYAYSLDGVSWTRYCHNPVFVGDSGADWEQNAVKAAEVVYHDGWYLMNYTGGDTGSFQVGWAMSRNGLDWVRAPEPILGPDPAPGTWESNSVLSGAMLVQGDELWMWYSGTGATGSSIGLAIAPLEDLP